MAFRKRVRNKRRSARKFNARSTRTKVVNLRGPMRGGFRL